LHLQPVEDVLEIHPDGERHPLLPELEDPPQAHGFRRAPLITVVIIVRRAGAELPVRRVRPACRVQHQILRGIDAVAVQILQERRYAWNAVDERRASAGSARPLEQQRIQAKFTRQFRDLLKVPLVSQEVNSRISFP
jgi:hypothetical protein